MQVSNSDFYPLFISCIVKSDIISSLCYFTLCDLPIGDIRCPHLNKSLFAEVRNKPSTVLQIKELHLLLLKDINFYNIERQQRKKLICAATRLPSSQAINSITTESENLLEKKQCTRCRTKVATFVCSLQPHDLFGKENVFLHGSCLVTEFFRE